jgi:hypothetical protein
MSEPKGQDIFRAETRPAKKSAYQKPEFRFETVFETRALSCGKRHETQSGCHFNRKSS